MNRQRKVLITITYNEMGTIIDTKAEEVTQPVEPKRLPQPHKCVVYRDGSLCRHPIEACSECPKHEVMRALKSERPEGEWIDYTEYGYVECPFCHSATNCDGNKDELHFCFSCGADMRGEEV